MMNSIQLEKNAGFSLLELMVVVVIIGLIAAFAIPQLSTSRKAPADATAKSDLRNVMTALELYSLRNGTFPATVAELEATGFSLSPGVSFDTYKVETKDGVLTVHMHVEHVDSANKWHARYPLEGIEIEIR